MSEEQTEVQPGSDEYNQAMVDKFNAGESANSEEGELPVGAPPMPEGGREKYYNSETGAYDWESHAKELQFNLDGRQKPPEEKTENPKLKIETPTEEGDVKNIVAEAGLDMETLEQRLMENGDLSEDDYAALKKVGIPEELTRSYVENIQYRAAAQQQEALNYAGGEDNWLQMTEWAKANLPENEIVGINETLLTPNWKLAVDGLKMRMGNDAPQKSSEPQLIRGETQTGTQFGYRSKAEMKSDMASPEYQKCPAFRQQVAQKMQSATWDLDTV